jgi:hypothetical protein
VTQRARRILLLELEDAEGGLGVVGMRGARGAQLCRPRSGGGRRLGPDAPLMADANNAYTLENAEPLLQLDELGLMMIEQPLAWDDLRDHAWLQQRLNTPICLDKSITSLERAEQSGRCRMG